LQYSVIYTCQLHKQLAHIKTSRTLPHMCLLYINIPYRKYENIHTFSDCAW